MDYKMIVTDLDDTLLTSDKKISQQDLEAIKKAQEKRCKVCFLFWRPTFAMRGLAKKIEAEKYESYILSFNGSIITDCKTNENIFEASLEKEDLHSDV